MKRYFRLYWSIVIINLQRMIAFRSNFYWGIITTLSWTFLSVVTIGIYAGQSLTLAGWTRPELYSLAGVFAIITGISYFMFLINFEDIAININKGLLDSILLKPVDSQFLASTKMTATHNIVRIIAGILIVGFNIGKINIFSLLLFTLLLIAAISLLYSIWLLVVSLNFYSNKLSNVIGLLLTIFDEVGRTPSDTFRIASSWAFTFLLPFFMVVSFPVKALWNKLPLNIVAVTLVTAIFLFIISRKFWFYSLRRYESASS